MKECLAALETQHFFIGALGKTRPSKVAED